MRVLDISRDSRKFLDALEPKQFKQLATRVFKLQTDPFPAIARHLSGYPGMHRLDNGEFRVCYRVDDDVVTIVVVAKRNDDEAYRRLSRRA